MSPKNTVWIAHILGVLQVYQEFTLSTSAVNLHMPLLFTGVTQCSAVSQASHCLSCLTYLVDDFCQV